MLPLFIVGLWVIVAVILLIVYKINHPLRIIKDNAGRPCLSLLVFLVILLVLFAVLTSIAIRAAVAYFSYKYYLISIYLTLVE